MSYGIVVVLLGTVVAPSVLGAVTFLVLRKLDPESLKKRFVPAITRKPESNVAIAEFAQVGHLMRARLTLQRPLLAPW